jgi:hypothetical protein
VPHVPPGFPVELGGAGACATGHSKMLAVLILGPQGKTVAAPPGAVFGG